MYALGLDFLKFTFIDFVDVLLVALLLYYTFTLVKNTLALNIFVGALLVLLLWFVVHSLNMRLLSTILNKIMSVGAIATIVVFQPEIRRFLLMLGKNAFSQRRKRWYSVIFGARATPGSNVTFLPVIEACRVFKRTRTGALIVFVHNYDEQTFTQSCEEMDSLVSKRLLEAIFQKNSPLHDGAVVIARNKIKSASCILPLTDNNKLPPQFGLRHRAGIGVSENSDAVAVIVSEETGEVAYARQGKVRLNVSFTELEKLLVRDFGN